MEGSAPHLVRRSASAVLALLCACASVSGPAEKPTSARRQGSAVRSTPVDVRPGYRARIAVGIHRSGSQGNWTDIAVLTETDAGRRACDALLESQMRVLSTFGLNGTIPKTCTTTALPPPIVAAGEYLLVAERTLSDVEVLLLLPQASDGLHQAGKATVTDYARFQSSEACQRALAKMKNARRNDRASAEVAARSWLQDQVQEQEKSVKGSCDEKAAVDAQCARIGRDRAAVEKACRTSTQNKRCEKARQRAMERSGCEVEQERAGRSCENGRAALQAIRRRLAAPRASQDTAFHLECRKL